MFSWKGSSERTLQSTHTLRPHYFSLSVRGYQGSKVCSVANGETGGNKWETCTDEVSSSMQMNHFPSLLGPAPKWSTQSLPLVWLVEQEVQNKMIITWEIRSILKQVWLPGHQHLNLPAWSKNNSSVGVTNYKITLTNAAPVTKKASAHNYWLLLWYGFPAPQQTGKPWRRDGHRPSVSLTAVGQISSAHFPLSFHHTLQGEFCLHYNSQVAKDSRRISTTNIRTLLFRVTMRKFLPTDRFLNNTLN